LNCEICNAAGLSLSVSVLEHCFDLEEGRNNQLAKAMCLKYATDAPAAPVNLRAIVLAIKEAWIGLSVIGLTICLGQPKGVGKTNNCQHW
jgi:hypothetical protein